MIRRVCFDWFGMVESTMKRCVCVRACVRTQVHALGRSVARRVVGVESRRRRLPVPSLQLAEDKIKGGQSGDIYPGTGPAVGKKTSLLVAALVASAEQATTNHSTSSVERQRARPILNLQGD